jgi:hypothetical protein
MPVILLLSLGVTSIWATAGVVYQDLDGSALASQTLKAARCQSQLAAILRAAQSWSSDQGDAPPPGLEVLTNELRDPALLFCPGVFHESLPTNWSKVDWTAVDYRWSAGVDWRNPADIACVCEAHDHAARVEGSISGEGFRTGWPVITASPMDSLATPGDTVCFQMRLAPDALLPVSLQWRRTFLSCLTNVIQMTNPDDPREHYWVTNIVPVFTGTNLAGQTNNSLVLSGLQTNDSGFYDLVLSNSMGAAVSREAWLSVDTRNAGAKTNALLLSSLCSSNLRQIWLAATFWGLSRNGLLPQSFPEMTNRWSEPLLGWPPALFCPADTERVPPNDWNEVDLDDTSYELIPGERPNYFDVFCRCRTHRYYVSVDGVVTCGPSLNRIRPLAGGTVELSFRTFAGAENVLEASENLVDWTAITVYGPEPLDIRFSDFVTREQRFFRLRLQ